MKETGFCAKCGASKGDCAHEISNKNEKHMWFPYHEFEACVSLKDVDAEIKDAIVLANDLLKQIIKLEDELSALRERDKRLADALEVHCAAFLGHENGFNKIIKELRGELSSEPSGKGLGGE